MPPRRIGWMLLAASLLAAPSETHAQARRWTVQAGDVLSTIAVRAGVSVEDLRRWNELESDRIRVGQELKLLNEATEPSPAQPASVELAPERAPAAAPPVDLPTVVVEPGDTLSHIAARAGVRLSELLALNPRLNPDRVRAGQRVVVPESRRRIEHTVRRGERITDLTRRYEVTSRELRRWNPDLRRGLRAGAVLIVYSDVPESRSQSIGAANGGQLLHGERLPSHPAYVIRDESRAFGTLETVQWLVDAFDAVREAHPDAPKVRVHDISRPDGGPMTHHRSHQSGRDVDISYFYRRCGGVCMMRRINEGLLDVERQWALLEHWLKRGVVEAVFIDYDLQGPLYEHARARGATARDLHRWFQYPRGSTYPLGVIRHFPKHSDHLHVRFVCPETDPDCRGR